MKAELIQIEKGITQFLDRILEAENERLEMAHPTRFELMTYGLGNRRSILLSYGCVVQSICYSLKLLNPFARKMMRYPYEPITD